MRCETRDAGSERAFAKPPGQSRGGVHHEDERIAGGDQRQQIGGGVLVVQHLHFALASARSRLPPHRRIPHLTAAAAHSGLPDTVVMCFRHSRRSLPPLAAVDTSRDLSGYKTTCKLTCSAKTQRQVT